MGHALWLAFTMFWQIFWGLSLGFAFSAIIEVLIPKDTMSKLLPDGGPRSIATAGLIGAATSSCSYAAVAMERHSGNWRARLLSRQGWIAISHYYVVNWTMVWKDILVGLLIAGALGAWVPQHFWQAFSLQGHNAWTIAIWGAAIGPLIAMAAFTCSIGNVPLAAVLWNGGISFGGVAAFIFGDLIIPPILNIYRKYYSAKPTLFLFVTFYLVMVLAALCVEGIFFLLHWVPSQHGLAVAAAQITFNYTAVLNIVFAITATVLVTVFLRSGGPAMLRMMGSGEHGGSAHPHHGEHHGG